MALHRPIKQQGKHALWMAGAAIFGIVVFAGSAASIAQDSAQQLSATAAEEQVPAAFPDVNTPPEAPAQETAAQGAKPIPSANPLDPTQVPAEPEAKKLVPATAMGAAAQNVENNKQDGAPVSPQDEAAPAEEATAVEDTAPALPDILEKYTAKSDQVAADDALPVVDAPPMSDLGLSAETGTPNAADQSEKQLQDEIRTEAYDAALTGTFPLSPEQVQGLLKRYDETQEATRKPVYALPKPEITVQNISLDPGIVPPTIKTAVGNVTTINMLDATGAPWPVQDVTWAGDFEVVEPEEGGHIIRITPMEHFARGNIVIRMLTLKTPLTLTLETSREVVQYRVDARIPEYGPFAAAPLMQGAGKSTMVAGSPDLTSLLDGVMPGGMEKLQVSGVDGRTTAYSSGGTTYVRTPLTLLSPAWFSSVSSADGMNVYALTNAPVLLLSDGGEFMRATLQEKEDLLDE